MVKTLETFAKAILCTPAVYASIGLLFGMAFV